MFSNPLQSPQIQKESEQNGPEVKTFETMEIGTIETSEKSNKKGFFSQFFVIPHDREGHNAPQLGYFNLFLLFLSFGCRAFGGPVAQIIMMKDELVIEQKWISQEKFSRVFAVYQVSTS